MTSNPTFPTPTAHPDATQGYTEATQAHGLRVDFPPELLAIYPEDKRAAVLGMLAQDPRPAYVQDPERVYGVTFAGYDVKFQVQGDRLRVCGVIPRPGYSRTIKRMHIVHPFFRWSVRSQAVERESRAVAPPRLRRAGSVHGKPRPGGTHAGAARALSCRPTRGCCPPAYRPPRA